jgi:hypothetical protein
MGAADLDNIFEFAGFRGYGIVELPHRGYQLLLHGGGGGNVHRGWECVVRGLRHVHVVVGMNRLLAALFAAGQFDGAV